MATKTTPKDAAALAEAEARAEIEAVGYNLPLVLRLAPIIALSEDQFAELCALNLDLRIELNDRGELLIMPPTFWPTGDQSSELNFQLRLWAKRDGTGISLDSSMGVRLRNRAIRSPDAAWIKRSRLDQALAQTVPEDRDRFLPTCPDFVVELRSRSDRLSVTRDKMQEWIDNGVELGWLIDPIVGRVHVYRPGVPPEVLDRPDSISGDPLLPGFVLDLREVW